MTDYRNIVIDVASRHAQPGEDLEACLLAGAPEVITHEVALSIAEWLETDADDAWGEDHRHQLMAAEIVANIEP